MPLGFNSSQIYMVWVGEAGMATKKKKKKKNTTPAL
jgi:hypothetical protein